MSPGDSGSFRGITWKFLQVVRGLWGSGMVEAFHGSFKDLKRVSCGFKEFHGFLKGVL